MSTAIKLAWHKSEIAGWSACRGDVMFWSRDGRLFADDNSAWISFRAERDENKSWTLKVWTTDSTNPRRFFFTTLAKCKEAASLFAAAVAARYDGEAVLTGQHWQVESLIKFVAHAIEMWVEYPSVRDESDIKRLAEWGVEVTL